MGAGPPPHTSPSLELRVSFRASCVERGVATGRLRPGPSDDKDSLTIIDDKSRPMPLRPPAAAKDRFPNESFTPNTLLSLLMPLPMPLSLSRECGGVFVAPGFVGDNNSNGPPREDRLDMVLPSNAEPSSKPSKPSQLSSSSVVASLSPVWSCVWIRQRGAKKRLIGGGSGARTPPSRLLLFLLASAPPLVAPSSSVVVALLPDLGIVTAVPSADEMGVDIGVNACDLGVLGPKEEKKSSSFPPPERCLSTAMPLKLKLAAHRRRLRRPHPPFPAPPLPPSVGPATCSPQ